MVSSSPSPTDSGYGSSPPPAYALVEQSSPAEAPSPPLSPKGTDRDLSSNFSAVHLVYVDDIDEYLGQGGCITEEGLPNPQSPLGTINYGPTEEVEDPKFPGEEEGVASEGAEGEGVNVTIDDIARALANYGLRCRSWEEMQQDESRIQALCGSAAVVETILQCYDDLHPFSRELVDNFMHRYCMGLNPHVVQPIRDRHGASSLCFRPVHSIANKCNINCRLRPPS